MALFRRKHRSAQHKGMPNFRAGLIALVIVVVASYFGFTKANPFALNHAPLLSVEIRRLLQCKIVRKQIAQPVLFDFREHLEGDLHIASLHLGYLSRDEVRELLEALLVVKWSGTVIEAAWVRAMLRRHLADLPSRRRAAPVAR